MVPLPLSRYTDIVRMETPIRLFDKVEKQKHDMLPPFGFQTDMVDSMSPPHTAEYVSAQHALARDCATLQLIEEDMEECQVRIARAYAEMRLLERQHGAVKHRMSIHRARLSPLRVVPDQILQEIFQHCLPDTPCVVPNARTAPLVLTHVCRRWRIIVQATPELWSTIALRDCGVWTCELEVEMVKRWLGRSRTRPIRMRITCPPLTDFGLDGNVSRSDIFQLAIAHHTQLSDLYLDVNRTYLHHFLEWANFPVLRSIVISLHFVGRIDEPPDLNMPASFSAPSLRYITFKGNGATINLIPRSIFPQITHLSLDYNMTLDVALLFQDFPNLQRFSLMLSLSRDAHHVQLPPQRDQWIVVPSLLYLDVHLDKDILEFGDPEKLETLFGRLELPALHTLTIAIPVQPQFNMRTPRIETGLGNHAAWVGSPSVASLLSRSRHAARLRLVCPGFGSWTSSSSGGGAMRSTGDAAVVPVGNWRDMADGPRRASDAYT